MTANSERSKLAVFHTELRTWLGVLAIPLAVAYIGGDIQKAIAVMNTSHAYVNIAISILKDKSTETDLPLRRWAATVLEVNSPVPFPEFTEGDTSKGQQSMELSSQLNSIAEFVATQK